MNTVKLVYKVQVKNKLGLHTRPATAIVKELQHSKSDVHFVYKRNRVNAKSVLSLLMLAAGRNAKITVEIEGEDAETTLTKLIEIFEKP